MRRTMGLRWVALAVVIAVTAGCGDRETRTDRPKSGKAIENLKDGDVKTRQAAAMTLTSYRDPRAVEALIEALKNDQDAKVRRLAAAALKSQDDTRAVEPLIAALKDGDANVLGRDMNKNLGTTNRVPLRHLEHAAGKPKVGPTQPVVRHFDDRRKHGPIVAVPQERYQFRAGRQCFQRTGCNNAPVVQDHHVIRQAEYFVQRMTDVQDGL